MTVYQSRVIEFPDLPYNKKVSSGKLYFIDGDSLMFFDKRPEEVVRFKSLDSFCVGLDGIWVTKNRDEIEEGEAASMYLDINHKGRPYDVFELSITGNASFVDDVCVGHDLKSDALYVKDFASGDLITLQGDRKRWYLFKATDGDYIFTKEGFKDYVCFNMRLEEVWRIPNDKKCYVDSVTGFPQLYKDTVIYNIGPDATTRRDFEIAAFAKKDGSVVWKRVLEEDASSSILVGDKIYILMKGRMIVLDAATGDTLVDQPSGLKAENQVALYTDGEQLIAVSESEMVIRIFSSDGTQLIQEIELPFPLTIVPHYAPVNLDGKLYFSLSAADSSLIGAVGGLLELTPCTEGEEPTIKVDPRPPLKILTLENPKGEQEYMISLSHDNLEEVLRYSAITVQEIVYVRGVHMFTTEQRNKLFNGHIKLYIDASVLPKDAEQKIKDMAKSIEEKLKKRTLRAGDGKSPIAIEVEMGDGSRLLS